MDPVTVATAFVGFLSPIIAKGVEEVAKSALGDLYAEIKKKLSKKPEGEKAINQFEHDPAQGAEVFQIALIEQLKADRELMHSLAETLQNKQITGPLVNKVDAKNVAIAEKINKINMS